MKYLQLVDSQAQDLTDQIYGEIQTPSVRLMKDTNEVVARKTQTDTDKQDLITFFNLLSISNPSDSAMTIGEYVDNIYNGDISRDYVSELTHYKNSSGFSSYIEEVFDGDDSSYDFSSIIIKLHEIYSIYGSYDDAEDALVYAISYKDYYNVTETFESSSNSAVTSADTLDETIESNEYDTITDLFDFNNDGKINVDDLNILVSFKKYFPEYASKKAYNAAKSILTDGEHYISDVANCVLGFEEYDDTFDINGNGVVDEEDLGFFISYFIFEDLGITESTDGRRKAQSTNAVSFAPGVVTRTSSNATQLNFKHYHPKYRVKLEVMYKYRKKTVGRAVGTLSGTGTGAMIGSIAGPIGSIVGAAVGTIVGGISSASWTDGPTATKTIDVDVHDDFYEDGSFSLYSKAKSYLKAQESCRSSLVAMLGAKGYKKNKSLEYELEWVSDAATSSAYIGKVNKPYCNEPVLYRS